MPISNRLCRYLPARKMLLIWQKSVAFETVVANDYNLSVSSYVEAKDTAKLSISLS
ncbi:hypothetical protein ACP0HM_30725 [Escherichia coli]